MPATAGQRQVMNRLVSRRGNVTTHSSTASSKRRDCQPPCRRSNTARARRPSAPDPHASLRPRAPALPCPRQSATSYQKCTQASSFDHRPSPRAQFITTREATRWCCCKSSCFLLRVHHSMRARMHPCTEWMRAAPSQLRRLAPNPRPTRVQAV